MPLLFFDEVSAERNLGTARAIPVPSGSEACDGDGCRYSRGAESKLAFGRRNLPMSQSVILAHRPPFCCARPGWLDRIVDPTRSVERAPDLRRKKWDARMPVRAILTGET